jgi:hypothetical protein
MAEKYQAACCAETSGEGSVDGRVHRRFFGDLKTVDAASDVAAG